MNILVTGGAGYIGSQTCKSLLGQGHQVYIYDNLSNSKASFVKWGQLIEGDINNTSLLLDTLKKYRIEAVFHFAGVMEVDESMKAPMKYVLNNVVGTYNLLECLHRADVKYLIFSSSCASYGNSPHIPITETSPQEPVSVYGETKLYGEMMIQAMCKVSSLSAVVLRYFNAGGADLEGETGECHKNETHLIPLAIQSIFDPQYTLQIFGSDYPTEDGTCIRDYVHVEDLASAHLKALSWMGTQQGDNYNVFNLGSGQGSSNLQVIQAVESHIGGKAKYELKPRREGDSGVLVADTSKARKLLGWKPQHNLDTIVRTACEWYKAQSLEAAIYKTFKRSRVVARPTLDKRPNSVVRP